MGDTDIWTGRLSANAAGKKARIEDEAIYGDAEEIVRAMKELFDSHVTHVALTLDRISDPDG